jgi:hypothetical protein
MNRSSLSILIGAAFLAASIPQIHSQEPAPAPARPAPKTAAGIRYKPPVTGGPVLTVTGGSRAGGVGDLPSLSVLAPEHEALTTQAQPALFWYQSGPAKVEIELTLTEPKKAQPLLNLRGGGEQLAGIHSISLARQKISLEPNLIYHWSVALIPDPKSRSKDVIARGVIKRVEAPADLTAKIENASHAERAVIYAEAGFWYDSLQALSLAIAAEPKNASLHRLRADLLEQGKLKEAAAAERKQ